MTKAKVVSLDAFRRLRAETRPESDYVSVYPNNHLLEDISNSLGIPESEVKNVLAYLVYKNIELDEFTQMISDNPRAADRIVDDFDMFMATCPIKLINDMTDKYLD